MLWEIIFDSFPLEIARKGKEIYSTDEYYLRFYSIAPEKCKYYSLPKTIQIVYQLCLRCLSPNYVHRPTIDWVVATLREVLLFGDKVYTLWEIIDTHKFVIMCFIIVINQSSSKILQPLHCHWIQYDVLGKAQRNQNFSKEIRVTVLSNPIFSIFYYFLPALIKLNF